MHLTNTLAVSLLISITGVGLANDLTPKQQEQWLNSPTPKQETRKISGRELSFLSPKQHSQVMHSENHVTISNTSLTDGWVGLNQCYHHLDAFPTVEVVYQYKNIRNLKIVSKQGIAKAEIQGQSVQLEDVSKGASLCIKADVQILHKQGAGYALKNGPFRRKFLDGYFPMRVTVNVAYPNNILRLAKTTPKSQPLFGVTQKPGNIKLNGIFEGELYTQLDFVKQ